MIYFILHKDCHIDFPSIFGVSSDGVIALGASMQRIFPSAAEAFDRASISLSEDLSHNWDKSSISELVLQFEAAWRLLLLKYNDPSLQISSLIFRILEWKQPSETSR